MRRRAWVERTATSGVVVVDVEALAADGILPGPDGRLRVPLDVLGVVGLAKEISEVHAGVTLVHAYPPGPR